MALSNDKYAHPSSKWNVLIPSAAGWQTADSFTGLDDGNRCSLDYSSKVIYWAWTKNYSGYLFKKKHCPTQEAYVSPATISRFIYIVI